ncbi:hypothetical protein PG987_005290 [Apiospora arundinis]
MQFIAAVMLSIAALVGANPVVYNPKITGTPTIHPGPNGTQIIFNGTLPSDVAIHNPSLGVAICADDYDSPGYADRIAEGVQYLRRKGSAKCSAGFLPDATLCQRVSCSWDSAIYVCNTGRDAPISPTCDQVASYASSILNECMQVIWRETVVEGQFWDNGWSDQGGYYVQVASADC